MHAEVQATGHPPEVVEHQSAAYLMSDFDGPAVSQDGPVGTGSTIDSDLDGRPDALLWTKPVVCLRPGVYQTHAVLVDRFGAPIVSAVGQDTLTTLYTSVHLLFPGGPIRDSGLDPRYVFSLQTMNDRGVLCMSGDFELNVQVDHTIFDPTASPFVVLGTTFTSSAADTNADGRFDALHVMFSGTNVAR